MIGTRKTRVILLPCSRDIDCLFFGLYLLVWCWSLCDSGNDGSPQHVMVSAGRRQRVVRRHSVGRPGGSVDLEQRQLH
jgi:hypothetical protein